VVVGTRCHLCLKDKVTSSADIRFEVCVVVNINSVVCWSVAPCSLVFTSVLEERTVFWKMKGALSTLQEQS
jgi:hypothetical protein